MLKGTMISKGCFALLASGFCFTLLMVVPVSAASDSPGLEQTQSLRLGQVSSERKKADFVGSWTCSSTMNNKDPGGRGEMTMISTEKLVSTADGKSRGTASIQLKLVMKKDGKVLEIDARWTLRGVYSWRLNDSQLCQTLNEVTVEPDNEHARKIDERRGSPMKETIPLGEESCSEIVMSSRDEYVIKDAPSGVSRRCKRN